MLLDLVIAGKVAEIEGFLANPDAGTSPQLCDALILACQRGAVAIIDALVKFGVSVNCVPTVGPFTDFTPLYAAALFGQLEATRTLVGYGADVNQTPSSHRMSPIMAAIDQEADQASQIGCQPRMSVSALLLQAGADPSIRNAEGRSAIDLARMYNYTDALASFRGLGYT